ncbi:hypothetical protein M758_UG229700 [Ceratodon purpureus]|nr:hypothetical protein M758_UG229700 [Ceratodon purpureus]
MYLTFGMTERGGRGYLSEPKFRTMMLRMRRSLFLRQSHLKHSRMKRKYIQRSPKDLRVHSAAIYQRRKQ